MLPDYAKRLSRKGVTVKSLYEEYINQHPDGYKRAQFGDLIRRYRLQTKAIGHVEHLAGDQMYVDFAGDRLQVTDAVTGEATAVEVFVAILPCSQLTYCEAVWSQKKEDLILACENAFHFFGGVPMAIVPDNSIHRQCEFERPASVPPTEQRIYICNRKQTAATAAAAGFRMDIRSIFGQHRNNPF